VSRGKNMKRRHLIKVVGGMAVPSPLVLHAQPLTRLARIGFLRSASATGSAKSVEALRTGLRDHGYVRVRLAALVSSRRVARGFRTVS
jgi:hypothetical protein